MLASIVGGLLLLASLYIALMVWIAGPAPEHLAGNTNWVEQGDGAKPDPQRRIDLQEAFKDQKPLTEAEIAKELEPFFQKLGGAFRNANGEAIVAHFDVDRMYDEILTQGFLPDALVKNRESTVRGLRVGLVQGFAKQAILVHWIRSEIKHIKKLPGNEAVVIVRHGDADGVTLKMRWWLTKRTGLWKLYDQEDLDIGMRSTTVLMAVVGTGLQDIQDFSRSVQTLQDAILTVAGQFDPASADRKLQSIAGKKLPKALEGLRWFATALVRLQQGKAKECLEAADKAQEYHPDMPCLDFVRGRAFNQLGQWAQGLKCLEAYAALLGDDTNVCRDLGESLRGVNRFQDAAKSYRKSLDYDPRNADSLLGLIRALAPTDNRDDLGQRFTQLGDHQKNFWILADDCKQASDGPSLEPIARAMQKIEPQFAEADYCLALALAWAQKTDAATAAFQSALAKEKVANGRKEYAVGFLQAMAHGGGAVSAYAAAPDPAEAFRILAAALKKEYRMEDIRKLVRMHAKKEPQDPLLPYYQAEMYVQDGLYDRAEKSFVAGMAKLRDEVVMSEFRSSRVTAKYYTGQTLAAYAEIGPRLDTFQQLANLCVSDNNLEILEALLKLYSKDFPDDVNTITWTVCLKIKQERLKEAVAQLQAALAKPLPAAQRAQIVDGFLLNMIDAGKSVEAYEAAPEPEKSFQTVANELIELLHFEDLRRLLEAHRKRFPNDLWLDFYSANLHVHDKAWDKAAAVLGPAFKKAPPAEAERFRGLYVLALYQMGQALKALNEVGPRKETYVQLARLMLQDRKGAELEVLDAQYRPHAVAGDECDFHRARAYLLKKQLGDAQAWFHMAYKSQTQPMVRQNYVREFVREMADAAGSLAAYRAVPDKQIALQTLAQDLVFKKQVQLLGELLDEHARNQAPERWSQFYRAEWHLLRGEAVQAEGLFAAGLAQAPLNEQWSFKNGLWRARILGRKAVATYQELGSGLGAFRDLAHICVATKNSDQLEALLGAFAQSDPDETDVHVEWQVELRWLKKDYEAVLRLLSEHAKDAFAIQRNRWKYDNLTVRALVKLQRFDEAVRRTDEIAKSKFGNRLLVVLARAAAGDVQQTIALVAEQPRYFVADCYRDEDLGPLLRRDAFQPFRQRFPEPAPGRFDEEDQ